jgi:curved DNA-binding protein CbpA
MSKTEPPWDVLALKPGASDAEIEAAYQEKAKAAHPDRPGGSHGAMTRLNEARGRALGRKG